MKALLNGADASSPPWRQLSAFAGVLLGFEGSVPGILRTQTRRRLEETIVESANAALGTEHAGDRQALDSVILILSHVCPVVRPDALNNLQFDMVLQQYTHATLFSEQGLHSGYFLGAINADVVQVARSQFSWSKSSLSFQQIEGISQSPMIAGLGSLSLLGAMVIERVRNIDGLRQTLSDISTFARSLLVQWRQNKLSEIDPSEETAFLTPSTIQTTLPLLWQILRSAVFHAVTLLQAILQRLVISSVADDSFALFVATETLQTLRELAFITHHGHAARFSQYHFSLLSAVDILAQYPQEALGFLHRISGQHKGVIPHHPVDRCLDQFYFNLAEHFATVLPPAGCETLLIDPARPYLLSNGDPRLTEIFESAHCVVLAVFSQPQNHPLLQKHLHFYLDVLFESFPQALSARQFRLAIKTLVYATSLPNEDLSDTGLLPPTILEIVKWRLDNPGPSDLEIRPNATEDVQLPNLTPQSAYLLSIIDSLPILPSHDMDTWLRIVAESTRQVSDPAQARLCIERFGEVLQDGSMDTERASRCISWWNSYGGRETIAAVLAEQKPA